MINNLEERLKKITILPSVSIKEGVQTLDKSGIGVLAICDKQNTLLGIVTDGDIRRAILRSITFDQEIGLICNRTPLTAPQGVSRLDSLHLMNTGRDFVINHLPVVDNQGMLVDFILRSDLTREEQLPVTAVIMAGGFGTRLRPLTDDIPKPMLKVGGRPLLEHTILRLKESGVRDFIITTHYLPEKIKNHFGDGRSFGVSITYIEEDEPLGTGGALGLIGICNETLLVMNGDIMTHVDFRAMFDYHIQQSAMITVGSRSYEIQVPYGVLNCEGSAVKSIAEKPVQEFLVNAGIYYLDKSVLSSIPRGQKYNMTDLIEQMIEKNKSVVGFPIIEYWVDIGHIEDYNNVVMRYS